MPQHALAIVLGSLLAFYGNDLPDRSWCALAPILLLLCRYCPGYRFILVFTAAFLWSSALFHYHLNHRLIDAYDNRVVMVRGIIAEIPEIDHGRTSLYLKAIDIPGYPAAIPRLGRFNWYQSKVTPRAGELWQFQLKLKQPRGRANPAGFDFAAWQFVRGIDVTGYIRSSTLNTKIRSASGTSINYWRTVLASSIDQNCNSCAQRGLIKALVLGFRGDIDEAQKHLLQSSGTAHLLAISGLHIGMVALVFYGLGRCCWPLGLYRTGLNRMQTASLLAISAALSYAALAGFSLPTVRALTMFSVLLFALLCKSRINLLQCISLTVMVILVVDPRAVGSASFWLSIGALTVIAFVQFRLPRRMGWWRQLLVLQCFFSLLFAPLGVLIFDQLNPASLLANIIAIPVISFAVLPMALLACLISATGFDGLQLPLYLADILLGLLLDYLELLVSSGLQSVAVIYPVPLVLLASLSITLLLMPQLSGPRKAALILLLILAGWHPPRLDHGDYEVIVFDVGMGTSVLLRTRYHSLVYDFGPGRPGVFSAADTALLPVMRRHAIEAPDLLIVSHVDQDHSGGFQSFIGSYKPHLLVSGTPQELKARFALEHNVRSCHQYPEWHWDGVDFSFVSTASLSRKSTSNNRSCVLSIKGNHKTLIPGDIESSQELNLVLEHGRALSADILLVPHHGSLTSSSWAFLKQVQPETVVFTLARNNRWDFPKPIVSQRYDALGSRQFRSDRDGAVTITSGSTGLLVKTSGNPARRIWRRW
jgi:competence protein ComEC